MRKEAVLTLSEIEILKRAQTDPDIFTDYFFCPRGETSGWKFDDNFVEEGKWQKNVCLAKQKDICVIGGFGTGKTLGVAMAACYWSTLTSDFKFLNIAPKQWQAFQMYEKVIQQARNTRFEDLIWEKPRRPYAKIVIRFQIMGIMYESTLEFMSADRDATGILSWEGDWINIDEAGLLTDLEDIVANVGSRLRGSVRGRERLGRFSMISNSWDNFDMWYYFDLASDQPDQYLSIVVSSRHNKNITEEQLTRMVARIPKEERERFIEGARPEGRGKYFSHDAIVKCQDKVIGEYCESKVEEGIPGYVYEKSPSAGVVDFAIPPVPRHLYMILGDPGTGDAPRRNAPVLMVWDCNKFPQQPARLVAFWWGSGGGRIGKFVEKMLFYMDIYRPVFTGIDSTGPQKNMAYLINEYLFREKFLDEEMDRPGYDSPMGWINNIGGLDFSGSHKQQYLRTSQLFIENTLLVWPSDIYGIRSQLGNYNPEDDRKIAQDIVATISMSAHAIRTWFHVDPEELFSAPIVAPDLLDDASRRLDPGSRARRSPVARPA